MPGIYSTSQRPPWMLASSGGKLLVVGVDRRHDLELARLTSAGRPTGGSGAGSVRVPLPGTGGRRCSQPPRSCTGGACSWRTTEAKPRSLPMNRSRTPGLGAGPLELVRVLASGALDRSFGSRGFVQATGPRPPPRKANPPKA